MKKTSIVLAALLLLSCGFLSGCREDRGAAAAKPVIYLYPEETEEPVDAKPANCPCPQREMEVTVSLDYDGELTCVYPAMENGAWTVTASPDGTLTDAGGQVYNYLYWEGVDHTEYDFSQGFCVPGGETAAFLEDALAQLGLTRREANEFIVYWLPRMEPNPYNLIAFQSGAYTDHAVLTVTPEPDSVLRVFMAWKPLASPVVLPEQVLTPADRSGFTVVEWGGTEVPS